MHSSRMCTIRNSSRFWGGVPARGVCVPACGVYLPGGRFTCSMVYLPGGYLPGGYLPGGYLPGGGGVVYLPGGCTCWGLPAQGSVPAGGVLAQVLPCEQNDRQV